MYHIETNQQMSSMEIGKSATWWFHSVSNQQTLLHHSPPLWDAGGCFTNVSRALQNILLKFMYCRNSTCDENFKLKLRMCGQSHALGTRTKFQLKILTINVISGVVYFRGIILDSSRNVSETTPRSPFLVITVPANDISRHSAEWKTRQVFIS